MRSATLTNQPMTDDELAVIARFEVRHRAYLATDGTVLQVLRA